MHFQKINELENKKSFSELLNYTKWEDKKLSRKLMKHRVWSLSVSQPYGEKN